MYQLNVMYANRTETKDGISSSEGLALLIEDAFKHQEGKERAREIIVYNLSKPIKKNMVTGQQPAAP